MKSLNFPDTNVWQALVWERHLPAEAAQEWFTGCVDEQFFFCRFTQVALLRLLTTKAVIGKELRTMAGAWGIYNQCCADERIAMLADGLINGAAPNRVT